MVVRRVREGAEGTFWGTFHLREGTGCAGRSFALHTLSGRGVTVPRHILGDGERFRANKISEKTYEIFFRVSGAYGA